MAHLKTICWENDCVKMVAQTKLPIELSYRYVNTVEEMYDAIKILDVRGAPAIGVAAAYGIYLAIRSIPDATDKEQFITIFNEQREYLNSSRPTAVNLGWALNRINTLVENYLTEKNITELKELIFTEAEKILQEDRASCRAIGEFGFDILKNYNTLLTHCNAGGLATSEYGTALSPIYVAQENGKNFHVYADETRPLLQGARITALELKEAGLPVTLICDNMAATVMREGKIDAVIVGADRIAANGDTANKIGTYSVALCAKAHSIPFYVAAPFSTFDLSLRDGTLIPIEERDSKEITHGFGRQTGPDGIDVYNPAFDVTPHELITAIITDKGVVHIPTTENVKSILCK